MKWGKFSHHQIPKSITEVVITCLFVWLAFCIPRLQLKAFDQSFALVRNLNSDFTLGVLQNSLNSKYPITDCGVTST
jgi:hypothetical protein